MTPINSGNSYFSKTIQKYFPNKFNISQSLKKLLPIFPYIIIVTGLIFVVYSVNTPIPNNSTSIAEISTRVSTVSAISAFFTVVLTGLYVAVNSKQLDVMAKQLNEMKNDRELQNQPLPWISQLNFFVEKPRLYYTPPEKLHSVQSRYLAYFFVKNLGSFPAVCTDVSSSLIILKDKPDIDFDPCFAIPTNDSSDTERSIKEKYLFYRATSTRIDILEEKDIYPKDAHKTQGEDFLFTSDYEGVLLKRLIDGKNIGYPILTIRILYKNILGACFVLHNMYHIYPNYIEGELSPVLKNWMSQIVSFPISHSDEFDRLKKLKKLNNIDEHQKLFAELKEKFSNSTFDGNFEQELEELRVIPIPGYFSIKSITEEEYNKIIKDISYGFLIC